MAKKGQLQGWLMLNWIPLTILVVAAVLRLAQAATLDVYGDGGLNAVRAIGWFDFLGSGTQTTPIQWFDTPPFWTALSFHDAPPLVFAIQYLFFSIFGDSALVLRLPFVLAGLAITGVLFVMLKRARGLEAAVLGASVFAVSSYAVWTTLSAYLEGIGYLFVFLSFYYFWRYFETKERTKLFFGAVYVSLALLSKYTAVFLIPAIALYLVIWQRKEIISAPFLKNAGIAVAILLLVLSPVIIYNYAMFVERGHFDAALSSMVGMHPEDFSLIADRSANTNPVGSLLAVWKSLYETSSLPLVLLFASSLAFIAFRVVRGRADVLERLLLLTVLSLFALFAFAPTDARFLSLFIPFLAVAVGVGGHAALEAIRTSDWHSYRKVVLGGLAMIVLLELGYSINTNVLRTPVGKENISYSSVRVEAKGFSELESYIHSTLPANLPRYDLDRLSDYANQDASQTKGKPVYVYDGLISWSGATWHFNRLRMYYKMPFIPLVALNRQAHPGELVRDLAQIGGRGAYFIETVGEGVVDAIAQESPEMSRDVGLVLQRLRKIHTPSVDIRNHAGDVVFRVYRLESEEGEYPYELVFR